MIFICSLLWFLPAIAQPFSTIFGDRISQARDSHISLNFQYGFSSFDSVTATVGTGTTSTLNSMAVVQTGIGSTGSSTLQSANFVRYRPGHEAYAFFTAAFLDGGVANATQWIGLFDASDGIAVGFNGSTFSVLFRNGGVSTTISQSSFNGDRIDGSGASGFTLNPTQLNVFRISYGWLGAAPLKFQILKEDGEWITFHTIQRPNSATVPSFSNPVLPMRMEVTNSGNTTNRRIASGSWNAGVIGSPVSRAGYRLFSLVTTFQTLSAAAGETHLVTLRNKSSFSGAPNKIDIRITSFVTTSFSNSFFAATLLFRLLKNATVAGTSFSDVDAASSVVEFSDMGTYSASTGEAVFTDLAIGIQRLESASNNLFSLGQDVVVTLLPGETLTVTGFAFTNIFFTSVANVFSTITWEERF